jgi:predicted esterase
MALVTAAARPSGDPRDPVIDSHHLPVPRTARYCTLGSSGPAVRELWIACHGYGQLAADFLAGFGAVAGPERLVVAPEALSRFYMEEEVGPHGAESRVGATWMTREDRLTEIEDYVGYLDRLYQHVRAGLDGAAPLEVVALGYSQGTATIARWAARTTAHLDELVLWGGRLPPELEPAALAERWGGLRVTLVVGTRDRWLRESAVRDEAARLREQGLSVGVLTFEGGHRLDDEALRRVARAPGVSRESGPDRSV